MKIDVKSSSRIIIEIDNGKKYEVSTEEVVSGHLYVRREDQSNISVEGFTDRTVELGTFKDIKIK